MYCYLVNIFLIYIPINRKSPFSGSRLTEIHCICAKLERAVKNEVLYGTMVAKYVYAYYTVHVQIILVKQGKLLVQIEKVVFTKYNSFKKKTPALGFFELYQSSNYEKGYWLAVQYSTQQLSEYEYECNNTVL